MCQLFGADRRSGARAALARRILWTTEKGRNRGSRFQTPSTEPRKLAPDHSHLSKTKNFSKIFVLQDYAGLCGIMRCRIMQIYAVASVYAAFLHGYARHCSAHVRRQLSTTAHAALAALRPAAAAVRRRPAAAAAPERRGAAPEARARGAAVNGSDYSRRPEQKWVSDMKKISHFLGQKKFSDNQTSIFSQVSRHQLIMFGIGLSPFDAVNRK